MSETDDLDDIREQKLAELKDSEADGSTDAVPTEPIHIDSAEHLQEITQAYDVVLVDFYADWCGPCKMIEPIVADLAAETDAAVAKVDVDAHQQLATQYRVQGVPTLILFSGGEAVEQLTGARDKSTLASLIEQHG